MRISQINNSDCSFKSLKKVVVKGEFRKHPELAEKALTLIKETKEIEQFYNKYDTKLYLTSSHDKNKDYSVLNIKMRYPRWAMSSTFKQRLHAFLISMPILEEPEVNLLYTTIGNPYNSLSNAESTLEDTFNAKKSAIIQRIEEISKRAEERLAKKEKIRSERLQKRQQSKQQNYDDRGAKIRVKALINEMLGK